MNFTKVFRKILLQNISWFVRIFYRLISDNSLVYFIMRSLNALFI